MSVLVCFIFSLAIPGTLVHAANPSGMPYIIVFKDTVKPAVEAPEVAKAYGLQKGLLMNTL
jgi:hypothetical protein